MVARDLASIELGQADLITARDTVLDCWVVKTDADRKQKAFVVARINEAVLMLCTSLTYVSVGPAVPRRLPKPCNVKRRR